MPRSNLCRRGLTLMELMVVIAILTVLAAITLPAFQAARERAKVTRSVNNLRQTHLALSLYAETHGRSSPLGFGLPHRGGSTLLELGMIPWALTRTGGTAYRGPNSDVYVWFIPDYDMMELVSEWHQHVNRTQGNPVFLLDQSHNPKTRIYDPFYPKLCIVLRADGSVRAVRRKGYCDQYHAWEGG